MLQSVLAICGGISIMGGAGAVILKVCRPAVRLNKRVEELESHSTRDYENIQNLTEMQKAQSKCLLAILNHQITGNGIDSMKKIRDEMTESILMH